VYLVGDKAISAALAKKIENKSAKNNVEIILDFIVL
jgi:hypothetical protein